MDWTGPIDAYCERLAPGLLAEPLNALSNLAFFVAAAYGLAIARRERSDRAVWLLACLVGVIGLGSLLFHTFANRWSMLADVVPITIFIYAYFAFGLRRFLGLTWPLTVLLLGALLAANVALAVWTPPGLLNGSISYLPALLAAIAMALALRSRDHPAHVHLTAAAITFAFSLAFRTADRVVCHAVPTGTHFVWHLLNALVLGLYLEAAARFGGYHAPKTN
ncbi:MAG: ceramidase domain-containing protein [Rhizobiales bacterium]|nr:ceramidase domain-containing protein [Hyphomicrobiales bacterium]